MPVPAPVTMAILAGPPLSAPPCAVEPALLAVIDRKHNRWLAVSTDIPASHAGRVERHRHIAASIEPNDAPFPANRLQGVLDDGVGRSPDRHVRVLHAGAVFVRG